MRTFFVLGSKLLGVLFLYWSIIGLAGTIMTIQHIETMGVSILITGHYCPNVNRIKSAGCWELPLNLAHLNL